MSIRGLGPVMVQVVTRMRALKAANCKVRETWKRMGPGSPIGALLYVHPNKEQILKGARAMGWHATNLHHRDLQSGVTIEEQIKNGKFDKRGIDIYIAFDPKIAVHFGAVGREIEKGIFKPILLNACSSVIPETNEQFGTHYFSGSTKEDVYITDVYGVDENYLDFVTNPELRPTEIEKVSACWKEGLSAYSKALGKF